MKENLINIYYYNEGSHYGLNVVFESKNKYLLFDSSKFSFVNKFNLDITEWKIIKYDKLNDNVYING
jgi:hypothetical protein